MVHIARRGISQFEAPLGNIGHCRYVDTTIYYRFSDSSDTPFPFVIERDVISNRYWILIQEQNCQQFCVTLCIKTFLQENRKWGFVSIVLEASTFVVGIGYRKYYCSSSCNMRVNTELKIRYLNNNLKLFVSIDMTVWKSRHAAVLPSSTTWGRFITCGDAFMLFCYAKVVVKTRHKTTTQNNDIDGMRYSLMCHSIKIYFGH